MGAVSIVGLIITQADFAIQRATGDEDVAPPYPLVRSVRWLTHARSMPVDGIFRRRRSLSTPRDNGRNVPRHGVRLLAARDQGQSFASRRLNDSFWLILPFAERGADCQQRAPFCHLIGPALIPKVPVRSGSLRRLLRPKAACRLSAAARFQRTRGT